jgi:hypothetical protein
MSAIRASVAHHHMVDIKIAAHWSYDFLGGLHVVTGAHLFVIIRQVVSCAARQNHQVYELPQRNTQTCTWIMIHRRVEIGGGTRSNSLWLVLYLLQVKNGRRAHYLFHAENSYKMPKVHPHSAWGRAFSDTTARQAASAFKLQYGYICIFF